MNDEYSIERAFLGSVLSGAGIPPDVTERMFYSGRNRIIFKALQELKPQCLPDILILTKHLTKIEELDAAGGPAYIAELTSIVPGPSNIEFYTKTLIEDSRERESSKAVRLAAEHITKGKAIDEIAPDLIQKLAEHNKPVNRKTDWTAAELLKAEFPSIQWIIPGLISTGLTILAGAPKLGKSWLALNLSLAVSAGAYVLGKIPVNKIAVLYLSLEDTGRHLKNRLMKLQAESLDNLYFRTEWATGTAGIYAYLQQHKEIRFVIIDTWIRFIGPVDINDYALTTKNAAALKAVADELDIGILVITHTKKGTTGKNYDGDWVDGVIGSQGLSGAADSTMVLRRVRGNKHAELLATGRDIEEKEFVLTLDLDCGGWTIDGEKRDIQESELRQTIIDWLKDNGPHGPSQIHKGINAESENVRSISTVKTTLIRMADAGTLQNIRGIYSVPQALDYKPESQDPPGEPPLPEAPELNIC
jgi:hypothetical protein